PVTVTLTGALAMLVTPGPLGGCAGRALEPVASNATTPPETCVATSLPMRRSGAWTTPGLRSCVVSTRTAHRGGFRTGLRTGLQLFAHVNRAPAVQSSAGVLESPVGELGEESAPLGQWEGEIPQLAVRRIPHRNKLGSNSDFYTVLRDRPAVAGLAEG